MAAARSIQLTSTDLVFVTTTPSYAIETMVQKTKDMLYRAGAEVKFIADDLEPVWPSQSK
ncbi:hypothetical protein ACW185_05800 [Limosilactobacillus fermentum]